MNKLNSLVPNQSEDAWSLYEQACDLLIDKRYSESEELLYQALALEPTSAVFMLQLAYTLHSQEKYEEALHYYSLLDRQELIAAMGNVAITAWEMAADAALKACKFNLGRLFLEKALQRVPHNLNIRLKHLMSGIRIPVNTDDLEFKRRRYSQDLDLLNKYTVLDTKEQIDSAVYALKDAVYFYLAYQGHNDVELQRSLGNFICRVMAAKYPQYTKPVKATYADDRKIKVGFMSAHFYWHSVCKTHSSGWVKNLDKNKFTICSYYAGDKEDFATDQIRNNSDFFFQSKETDQLAARIFEDQLDILIYTGIGMEPNSLVLAALRLAPIQCTSWGHPVTSGLPTVDYYLSSDLMEPINGQEHYTEELVRLPNIGTFYEQVDLPKNLPELTFLNPYQGKFIYLCNQNLLKYLPKHDDVFALIASQVPDSVFVFIGGNKAIAEIFKGRLKATFEKLNLAFEDHVCFAPKLNWPDFCALNRQSDVFLDGIGWSGCNTALESLPYNLPIVTLPGDFMRGRHCYAILKMMGVTDTIANNIEEYTQIAVRLAHDSNWLNKVSNQIKYSKYKIYRDLSTVRGLETFLTSKCRTSGKPLNDFIAVDNQAKQLYLAGDKETAINSLEQILKQKPDFAEGWKKLAAIHNEAGQHQEAINCLNKLLQLEPDNIDCLADLAQLHSTSGVDPWLGLKYAEHALKKRPSDVGLLNSYGRLLYEVDRFEESVVVLKKGLAIGPQTTFLLGNLGNSYLALGKAEKAIQCYSTALQHQYDRTSLLKNRSFAHLMLENYQQGWIDHEARLEDGSEITLMHQDLPRWDGGRIDGKTLLIWVEQVYGDSIQFARFIPLAKQLAGSSVRIVLQVLNQNLAPLYKGFSGVDDIVIQGQTRPHADYQIPLCSLAGIVMAGGDTMPSPEGYLKADSGRKEHWCQLLNSLCKTGKPKIGLVWGGRKPRLNANRSMELHHLLPLFDAVDANWFSLQLGDDRQQLQQCDNPVIDLAEYLTDFGEAAAAISNLDLLISIDTAAAHLAGALGVPVWVMLKLSADWRWLRNRNDSPWYSSARLFRQKDAGDWQPVVAEVGQQLKVLFGD